MEYTGEVRCTRMKPPPHDHNENVSGSASADACPVERQADALRSSAALWGRRWAHEFIYALFLIGVSTAVALGLRPYVTAPNLVMVYLLGVVGVAMRCSREISVVASFLSVAAFDFFCVPPYLTFQVRDYEYVLTFAAMLVVALVISTQTAGIRKQANDAAIREARSETLYHLSRRVAGQTRVFDVARMAAEYAEEVFQVKVVIFLPEEGRISFARRTCDWLPVPRGEESIAQWVLDHGEKAGRGMEIFSRATAVYLPLTGSREIAGIMAVVPAGSGRLARDQIQLLEVFADQLATAIERTRSQNAAETARLQVKTEQMRSSLLSAVSHDLRTPLASITGAASTLRSQSDKLLPETRQELVETIADEAERLSRLVSNLLDMTRLESGVELRRDLYPLEEIVGAALQRMEHLLGRREVTTHLPDNLPLVSGDDVLLGQLLVNLLENATKYTPEGTPIEITAESGEDAITLEIRDRGPGFAPNDEQRLFEKFYRGRSAGGARGAGLGLAICRAIVDAHRGSIEAFNRAGGGAVFQIRLPLGGV
jgi:two-component system sensor histidine kinase KdpD